MPDIGMSVSDWIAVASLILTIVSTVCVMFLSYAALRHTARPNVQVRRWSNERPRCDEVDTHIFEIVNVGHWYGSPMAVDVVVFCDFPPVFQLEELLYGSVQEHRNTDVKRGKGGARYLKAKRTKVVTWRVG